MGFTRSSLHPQVETHYTLVGVVRSPVSLRPELQAGNAVWESKRIAALYTTPIRLALRNAAQISITIMIVPLGWPDDGWLAKERMAREGNAEYSLPIKAGGFCYGFTRSI